MFKKKKGPYPRSLSKRLTRRIMLTMLIVMGFVTYGIFQAEQALVVGVLELISVRYLKTENQKIHRVLSDVSVAAVNSVPLLEEHLDQPDKLYKDMERMVRLNPGIRSCGISFIDSYYPQKGRWFCPYAQLRDSNDIVVTTIGDKQKDYLHQEWFTTALASEKGMWSKPYLDGVDQKTPLVSWLMPVRNKEGKTVAILGADLSLESLEEDLKFLIISSDDEQGDFNFNVTTDENETWSPEYQFYTFVIDSTGNYVVHPDHKRLVKKNYFDYAKATPDTRDDEIGRQMIEGQRGDFVDDSYVQEIEGESVYIVFMPVKHANWSVACVIPSIFVDIIGYVICGVLISMIIIGLLVVFFVGRRSIKNTVKPLKQLSASADEVAKGNFGTQLPVIKSRDEIHQLRDSFEGMQHSLTSYIAKLKTTTASKAAIENELKVAHDIQMSMLPKTFPPFPNRHDIDIYCTLTPAKEVGGDLFDFYIRDEKLIFCIGDVSGKGVPASLFMAVARSLFRNISSYISEPHRIVNALNVAMTDNNEASMFVTLLVGVLDLQTGLLRYCNAGHNEPLIMGGNRQSPSDTNTASAGAVRWLPCDPNVPIGVVSDWDFTCQEELFDAEAMLFLYTDGLNEAENATHEQFGQQRIIDVAEPLMASADKPVNVINKMAEAVKTFVGQAEQSDDLTMMAIKYIKTHGE